MNTSPKPTDRFESPRFLINQTRSNIAEFEELCKKFFDTHKGEQRVDVDLKTGDKTIKVAFEHLFPVTAFETDSGVLLKECFGSS